MLIAAVGDNKGLACFFFIFILSRINQNRITAHFKRHRYTVLYNTILLIKAKLWHVCLSVCPSYCSRSPWLCQLLFVLIYIISDVLSFCYILISHMFTFVKYFFEIIHYILLLNDEIIKYCQKIGRILAFCRWLLYNKNQ